MTTKDRIKSKINAEIEFRQKQLELLDKVQNLDKLDLPAIFMYATQIDFDRLTHEQVIEVIKVIGGKWDKRPDTEEATIDYTTQVNGVTIRLWQGQPPPNCKIIEVLEEVPAQPARTVTKRKLVCT